jgi:glycosyltransferase involved in cell wall biosynthesis
MDFSPKVSIIVATYNQEMVIKETLESIEKQTYKNIEVIISDDGSTDKTREFLSNFVKNKDNYFLHFQEKNIGITDNYNFLADKATGDYVSIFSGDDVMCAEKVESQVNLLEENPLASFCHHAVFDLDAESKKVRGVITHQYLNNITTIHDVLRNLGVPGSMTIMYRRNMVSKPVFNPEIRTASDWFQIITLTMAGDGLYIDRPLCYYRRDSNYNGKDTSKYEIDFLRTIELTRDQFSRPNDLISSSCDYALSRYLLGAGYRCLMRADRVKARTYFTKNIYGMKFKFYSITLILLTYIPLKFSTLSTIKNYYKRISRT